MRGYILLCDFAEAIGGKFYIMGGGWSRISSGNPAGLSAHVAAMIYVPWDDANRRRRLSLKLLTEDGHNVLIGDQPVEAQGDFEVGRPPGLAPGSELEFPAVFRFEGMPLAPGRYKFNLSVGAHEIGEAKFEVVTTPLGGS